jgi:thiosulfate dehydrogenase [quinone] large subunit
VCVSAPFAIMLMYWTAHMNFPFIENVNNYLIDYHIVYAGVLVYLIIKRARHALGLDGLFAEAWCRAASTSIVLDGGIACRNL